MPTAAQQAALMAAPNTPANPNFLQNESTSMNSVSQQQLQQYLANPLAFLTGGGTSLGAQGFQTANANVAQIQQYAQQQYDQAKQQLSQRGVNLDAYVDPSYQLNDPGQGASANMNFQALQTAYKIQAQQQAIQMAQAGQPVPNWSSQLNSLVQSALDPQVRAMRQAKAQAILNGTTYNPDPATAQAANAAAARVGAPLPYPNQSIGNMQSGGLFQNGQQAQQYYQNGQFNQQAYDQNYATQTMQAGFAPGGVGTSMNSGTGISPAGTSATPSTGTDPNVINLVRQALQGGNLTNLQNQSWWNSQPISIRQQAYNMLTGAMQDPNAMASMLQQTGVTNYQNSSWWTSLPMSFRQQSYQLATSAPSVGGGGTTSPGISGGSPAGGISTTPPSGQTAPTNGGNQAALDVLNNSGLPSDLKSLFSTIATNWDPSQEVNFQNVINQVNSIASNTIDPYYAQLANGVKQQIQIQQTNAAAQRGVQVGQEQMNAQQSIKNASNALEASGLSNTGESTYELGANGTYANTGTNPQSVMPTVPFGGNNGTVNQANQLIATSDLANYQQQEQQLSAQAEQQLGSSQAQGLVPNAPLQGNVTGTLQQQRNTDLQNTFNQIYQQQSQQSQAHQLTPVFGSSANSSTI